MDVNIYRQKIYKQKISKIAARLKEARIKSGFSSNRSFAINNNIKQRTYYAHEAGKVEISMAALIKYSELLNISYLWLSHGLEEYKDKPFSKTEIDADYIEIHIDSSPDIAY
jgi:hypothetical protein